MASEADHIALANQNHAMLVHLAQDVDRFPDWVATVAFYKAVHVAEAVFAADTATHSTSHENRRAHLRIQRFKKLFKNYKHLDEASRIARYLEDRQGGGYSTFTDYLTPENVIKYLVKKRLYRFEQEAIGFLTDSGKSNLVKVDPAQF